MSDDTGKPGQQAAPRRPGRRQVLREAGAAGAGLAVGLLSAASPAEAADGNPVLLGKASSATATTAVTTTKGNGLQATAKANGASGVSGVDASTGGGYGVHGTSSAGTGVYGTTSAAGQEGVIGWDTSTGGGTGVFGRSNNGTGMFGVTYATGQIGVQGLDNSSGSGGGYGVVGASTEGTGVSGTSEDGTGVSGSSVEGIGVTGASDNGTGISGSTSADGNYGVQGVDASSGGGYGLHGSSGNGTGAYGATAAVGNYGVQGVDASSKSTETGVEGGYGVYGTSVNGTGVYGSTSAQNLSSPAGVYGTNSANSVGAAGIWGSDISTNGREGVFGESIAGIGVLASTQDGPNALVSQGNAQVQGDLAVTGTVSKGGGAFKIDHPLDPGGKYLYHSFVESPDMKNVYDGTIVLDRAGRATVELPDWFEALNRDFRYQLTPVGSPAPGLHVAAKITGGRFTIAGGPAGTEVCWQVTGIRKDRWANAHRIPVEQDKPAADQGRYLHPDLYDGQPLTELARSPLTARNRPA
jgi:hypothetical protein